LLCYGSSVPQGRPLRCVVRPYARRSQGQRVSKKGELSMRVSRKSRAAIAVCVAALAAGSIAWSGTATAAAPSAAKSCTPDAGVTDTDIKIGSIVSTSGAGAAVADALPGIQARIAMANETNELGRRKITLVQEDD